jgi:hypothetical protein
MNLCKKGRNVIEKSSLKKETGIGVGFRVKKIVMDFKSGEGMKKLVN